MNKRFFIVSFSLFVCLASCSFAQADTSAVYQPSPDNIRSRQQFQGMKLGIFLHWGIYSSYAQAEWFLYGKALDPHEYAKAARGFYPIRFDADEWVRAFKDAGARYVTITARHHDGFSMFQSRQSAYNIVDATPFHRDVIKEMSQACQRQGMRLHLYYSLLDWTRDDYPPGSCGKRLRRTGKGDYNSYFAFMKSQLTELLTQYGPIGAIWLDGEWDHKTGFDWRLPEVYQQIHSLQPACLVGHNHHHAVIPGEDFQMFERDLPGENKAGYSPNAVISKLPLEMCQTMNNSWGYTVSDLNYKSVDQIIHLLVSAAGKGANLLLNIGPQADGELPELALDRLKSLGKWTKVYGETIYDTRPADIQQPSWGAVLQRNNHIYLHILNDSIRDLSLPLHHRVLKASIYDTSTPIAYKQSRKSGFTMTLPQIPASPDLVIDLQIKEK